MSNKRWGVALKKNVVEDKRTCQTKHDSFWYAKSYTVFRKFATRKEAREFSRSWKNPTYIVDLAEGAVVR